MHNKDNSYAVQMIARIYYILLYCNLEGRLSFTDWQSRFHGNSQLLKQLG